MKSVFILATVLMGCLLLSTPLAVGEPSDDRTVTRRGKIVGEVIDAETGEPLLGSSIAIVGGLAGTKSDVEGAFTLPNLKPGHYSIRVSHVGYETRLFENVSIDQGNELRIDVKLVRKLISVRNIVVAPGRFAIMDATPVVRQGLSRRDIESIPQLGEDIYRAVRRLPGISSNDYSARFNVRGGQHDEVLVLLDGMELYEPFHLKDVDGGALSIIDIATIEGIDLMTGGFTANYGDHMSGVFDIKTKRPPVSRKQFSLGISFMNMRAMSRGAFADNKGSWLLSARRGYLDIILDLTGDDTPDNFSPKYYDLLAKVQYQLTPSQLLSVNLLHSRDYLDLVDFIEDRSDTGETAYGNSYVWLSLHTSLRANLTVRTQTSFGRVTHDRFAASYEPPDHRFDFRVSDDRRFHIFGLKQDWELELSERNFLKAGMEVRRFESSYDHFAVKNIYHRTAPGVGYFQLDTTEALIEPSGERLSVYVADRFRVVEKLTTELGVRYDRVSYSDDENISPRVNLVYDFTDRTSVRGGFGHYYQSQRIHTISIQDGEADFYPAEKAVHWVVGLQHQFNNGLQFRLDGYHKRYTDLQPRHANYLGDIELLGALEDDRYTLTRDGSTAKGIELYLKKENGGKFTWWASYALSWVDEEIGSIITHGTETVFDKEINGPTDQRHTIYLDCGYRPSENWQMNLAWHYHTGWPFTPLEMIQEVRYNTLYISTIMGEPLSRRYPSFSRVDLRINRYHRTSRGQFSVFLEIVNLLNRENVRHYTYDWEYTDSWHLNRTAEHWFKILPSLGVAYSF